MPNVKPAFPEFGTATPGMGSPHYVAPTGTQQTNGYAATSGEFTRGLRNWLDTHSYLSLTWLDDVRFAWSALDGDESDGGGWAITSSITQPTTGAGLTGTSGALEAEFNGRHVVMELDASVVYTASRDTYVDIDNEGTITYTPVNNGDPAPALASGDFRCFKVVTNGSDRTAVTTLAVQTPRITQQLYARGGVKLGAAITTDGAYDIGASGSPMATAHLTGLALQGTAVKSDVTPDTNNTYDLGSSTRAYAEAHSYKFNIIGSGDGVTYNSARTILRTIPASAFCGDNDYGVTDLPMWALLAASADPTNTSKFFVRTGIASSTAAICMAPFPPLPEGAIITAVRILADVTSGTVYAAAIRTPTATVGARTNLSSTGATTGEVLTGGPAVTTLSLDASTGVRTIENDSATYEVWIRCTGSSTVRIYSVEIEAQIDYLGG